MLLEISTSSDPLTVVSALAEIAATAVENLATLASVPPNELLTMIEASLHGEEGTAKP